MKQKLLLLLLSFNVIATFGYSFKVDGICYKIINNEGSEVTNSVEVTYYSQYESSYSGDIIIPSIVEYKGTKYTVSSIGEKAFYNCKDLVSVKIPNSVTSIGKRAFYECEGMTAVDISDSVTSIGEWAFYKCNSLTSIEIPNSVTIIDECAFSNCENLKTLDLSNSLTKIGNFAFQMCSSLSSIEIPNSVTIIGQSAFSNCSSLTSVYIPDSVTTLGETVFVLCSSLTSFTGKYASEDHRCLINEGVLNSFAPSGLITYSIPNNVTTIGHSAFCYCSELEKIDIPNTVTSIGYYAFAGCKGLKSIEIPETVISIESCVFFECSNLSSIVIPNSVSSIGYETFYGCESLESVILGDSVTLIGESAFSNCSALTSIEIPKSVTSIGGGAFFGCRALALVEFNAIHCTATENKNNSIFKNCESLAKVIIGDKVECIPNYTFYGCNLKEVKVGWENPAGLYIGSEAFTSVHQTNLYVPIGTTENYKYRSPWNNFKEIIEYMPGGDLGDEQCEAPSISIDHNHLIFTSSTPGAQFYYTIDCEDTHKLTNSEDGVIPLNGIYQISAYAYAEGYSNSDIITATIVWINPQVEDAGILSMEAKKAILIRKIGDNVQICGTEYGENIQLFSIDGLLLESTKAVEKETIIPYNLGSGQTYIIKYGGQAIKYRF